MYNIYTSCFYYVSSMDSKIQPAASDQKQKIDKILNNLLQAAKTVDKDSLNFLTSLLSFQLAIEKYNTLSGNKFDTNNFFKILDQELKKEQKQRISQLSHTSSYMDNDSSPNLISLSGILYSLDKALITELTEEKDQEEEEQEKKEQQQEKDRRMLRALANGISAKGDDLIKFYAMEIPSSKVALQIIENSYDNEDIDNIKRQFCRYMLKHKDEIYKKKVQEKMLQEYPDYKKYLSSIFDNTNVNSRDLSYLIKDEKMEKEDINEEKQSEFEKTIVPKEAPKLFGGVVAYDFLVTIQNTIATTKWDVGIGGTPKKIVFFR